MRGFLRTWIRTSLVAWGMAVGCIAAEASQGRQGVPLQSDSGTQERAVAKEQIPGLRLSIRVATPESTDSLRIHITFENGGDKDTVLNLGMMLGNGGLQRPTAVRLLLTDSAGVVRELHFADTRVAGRVDDYIVPLRAGSTYTLTMKLKEYWCPKSKEFRLQLTPQRYAIRAEFTGKGAQYVNLDTEVLRFVPFWTGRVESDAAQFQIGEPR